MGSCCTSLFCESKTQLLQDDLDTQSDISEDSDRLVPKKNRKGKKRFRLKKRKRSRSVYTTVPAERDSVLLESGGGQS